MKNKVLILFLTCFIIQSSAQKPFINEMIKDYEGKKNYTTIIITSKMFDLISTLDIEDKEMFELLNNMDGIKVIVSETSFKNIDLLNKIAEKTINYKLLKEVIEDEQTINFYIKQNKDFIGELIMIILKGNYINLMSFQGNIDLNKINKLTELLDIKEIENLKKIENF